MNSPFFQKSTLKDFVDDISKKISALKVKKNFIIQGYKKEVEKAEIEQIKKDISEN